MEGWPRNQSSPLPQTVFVTLSLYVFPNLESAENKQAQPPWCSGLDDLTHDLTRTMPRMCCHFLPNLVPELLSLSS